MLSPCFIVQRACRDDVLGRLEGFPALAMVWVKGTWAEAGSVLAGERMAREEPNTCGHNWPRGSKLLPLLCIKLRTRVAIEVKSCYNKCRA